LEALFSGEENFGRYLDLHGLFERYVNLQGIKRVDYVTYLEILHQFDKYPQDQKNASYQGFVIDVLLPY
jgi:splicing factor 3A subunit 3